MINYILAFVNVLIVFFYSLFSGDGGITITNNFPKSLNAGQTAKVELKVAKGSQGGFAKLQVEVPEGITISEIDNNGADFTFVEGIGKWVWASLPSDADLIVTFNLITGANANGAKTISAKYSYVENNAKQIVEMTPFEMNVGENSGVIANNEPPTNTSGTSTTSSNNTANSTTTVANPTASNGEPLASINVVRTITKSTNPNEYLINVKIKKFSTKGFARYSDDLVEGITAKADKTEGSSFSVADGKVKFVWVNVPEKEDLEISYFVSSTKNLSYPLNAEYAYLEENQSKKYKVPSETIEFKVEAIATNTTDNNSNISTPNKGTETNNSNQSGTNKSDNSTTETKTEIKEPVNASANLKSEPVSKVDGKVNFRVQIGAYSGAVTAGKLKAIHKLSDKINSDMADGLSKFMIGSYPQYKDAHYKRDYVKSNNGISGAFVVAYNQGKRVTVQEALMIANQKWFR